MKINKMGTYNYSERMLVEKLTNLLDNIEGDFNRVDLVNALEFMKNYAPTSESSKTFEKRWRKILGEKLRGEYK